MVENDAKRLEALRSDGNLANERAKQGMLHLRNQILLCRS